MGGYEPPRGYLELNLGPFNRPQPTKNNLLEFKRKGLGQTSRPEQEKDGESELHELRQRGDRPHSSQAARRQRGPFRERVEPRASGKHA